MSIVYFLFNNCNIIWDRQRICPDFLNFDNSPLGLNTTPRYIAFILLLLFGASQSSTWLFSFQINQHRKQERRDVYKHNKENRVLTYSEYNKLKFIEEKEILLEGKMFDIESVDFNENEVILHGHFDSKEDALLAKAKQKDSEKQENKSSKFPILFFENITTSCSTVQIPNEKNKFIISSVNPLCLALTFEPPPPKFV